MTKAEMKIAWEKQWNETKAIYDMALKELAFQRERQNKLFFEGKENEGYALEGCITGLKYIIRSLENVLYKEV